MSFHHGQRSRKSTQIDRTILADRMRRKGSVNSSCVRPCSVINYRSCACWVMKMLSKLVWCKFSVTNDSMVIVLFCHSKYPREWLAMLMISGSFFHASPVIPGDFHDDSVVAACRVLAACWPRVGRMVYWSVTDIFCCICLLGTAEVSVMHNYDLFPPCS